MKGLFIKLQIAFVSLVLVSIINPEQLSAQRESRDLGYFSKISFATGGYMEIVQGDMAQQVRRVFDNIQAVCQAAGGDLGDIVKLNVFLTDLGHFPLVNEIMAEYFSEPYPARAAIGVAALPKGAGVEMDAVMHLTGQ